MSANVEDVISGPPLPMVGKLLVPTFGPELAKALVAAQKAAKAVAKDAENTFHRYKYASAEAMLDEARGALASAGLAVMPLSVGRDPDQPDHVWQEGTDDKGKPTTWIVTPRRIRCTYLLMHESGQTQMFWFTTPVIPEKGRPEDKAEFGSRTENLGYAMRDLLLLPRGTEGADGPSGRDDRDNDGPRGPVKAPPREQVQQQTQTMDRALRLTKMLTGKAPDGCGWAIPRVKAWAKRHFRVDTSQAMTEQQLKDGELLALAFMSGGDIAYRSKIDELVAAGRIVDEPSEKGTAS